ncbi:MAG: hypothetical protein Q7S62_01245 [bacterium]|nr:hypothetical protein [bacterium]
MKRISWGTIQKRVMRLPLLAAEHAFPFTLLLMGIAGIFSLIIFLYGFSVQTKHVEQGVSLYDVKEELFSDMLGLLKERERNLESVDQNTFIDIFNPD